MTKRKSGFNIKSDSGVELDSLPQRLDHAINQLEHGSIDEKALVYVQFTNDIENVFAYTDSKNSSELYISRIFESISHVILDKSNVIDTEILRDIIMDLLLNIFLGSFNSTASSFLSFNEVFQLTLVDILHHNGEIDLETLDSWITLLLNSLLLLDREQIFPKVQDKLIDIANEYHSYILHSHKSELLSSLLKYFVKLSILNIISVNINDYCRLTVSTELLFYIDFSSIFVSCPFITIRPSILTGDTCTKLISVFCTLDNSKSLALTQNTEFLLESLCDIIKSSRFSDTVSSTEISDEESFEEHVTMKLDQKSAVSFEIEHGAPISRLFDKLLDLLDNLLTCSSGSSVGSSLLGIISEILVSYHHFDNLALEKLYNRISDIWMSSEFLFTAEWLELWKNLVTCSYQSGTFNSLIKRYQFADDMTLEQVLELADALGRELLSQGRANELITEGLVPFILSCISQYTSNDNSRLLPSLSALDTIFSLLGTDEAMPIIGKCRNEIILVLKVYFKKVNSAIKISDKILTRKIIEARDNIPRFIEYVNSI